MSWVEVGKSCRSMWGQFCSSNLRSYQILRHTNHNIMWRLLSTAYKNIHYFNTRSVSWLIVRNVKRIAASQHATLITKCLMCSNYPCLIRWRKKAQHEYICACHTLSKLVSLAELATVGQSNCSAYIFAVHLIVWDQKWCRAIMPTCFARNRHSLIFCG